MTVTPDGRHALTGGAVGTLHLWDLPSGALIGSFGESGPAITAVAITPTAHRGIAADEAGILRMWDLTSGTLLAQFNTTDGPDSYLISALALTPDGQYLTGSRADGQMLFLKVEGCC